MGFSLGSGRQEVPGRRKAVEECERLAVWAFRAGARPPGSEGIALAYTAGTKGTRTWLECPLCRRRASSLYRPTPAAAWACRGCHGLTYLSRRHSGRDWAMWRAGAWAYEILERTGGDWTEITRAMDRMPAARALALCHWLIRFDP